MGRKPALCCDEGEASETEKEKPTNTRELSSSCDRGYQYSLFQQLNGTRAGGGAATGNQHKGRLIVLVGIGRACRR